MAGGLVLAALVIGACSGPAATPASPLIAPSPTNALLSVANGTTVPVTLVVNGVTVETIVPGSLEDPVTAALPARPWSIEARSPTGRVLATLSVSERDPISDTAGRSVRADLACGRLDIWAGPPPLGGTFIPDSSKLCD
jgi:hypothetical protein